MQYLSVWKNELSFIQPGAVDHMTVLETLNLMENEDLDGYTTESWHFCHNLKREDLDVQLEYNKKIAKDLKVDDQTDAYCANNPSSSSVESVCENTAGHLTCSGDIEDLVCELRTKDFKSITFLYPKDKSNFPIENF